MSNQKYNVIYIPHVVTNDQEWKYYGKLQSFQGKLENFNPGGKTVFYNEELDIFLIIQYMNIVNVYPIDNYNKKWSKEENNE